MAESPFLPPGLHGSPGDQPQLLYVPGGAQLDGMGHSQPVQVILVPQSQGAQLPVEYQLLPPTSSSTLAASAGGTLPLAAEGLLLSPTSYPSLEATAPSASAGMDTSVALPEDLLLQLQQLQLQHQQALEQQQAALAVQQQQLDRQQLGLLQQLLAQRNEEVQQLQQALVEQQAVLATATANANAQQPQPQQLAGPAAAAPPTAVPVPVHSGPVAAFYDSNGQLLLLSSGSPLQLLQGDGTQQLLLQATPASPADQALSTYAAAAGPSCSATPGAPTMGSLGAPAGAAVVHDQGFPGLAGVQPGPLMAVEEEDPQQLVWASSDQQQQRRGPRRLATWAASVFNKPRSSPGQQPQPQHHQRHQQQELGQGYQFVGPPVARSSSYTQQQQQQALQGVEEEHMGSYHQQQPWHQQQQRGGRVVPSRSASWSAGRFAAARGLGPNGGGRSRRRPSGEAAGGSDYWPPPHHLVDQSGGSYDHASAAAMAARLAPGEPGPRGRRSSHLMATPPGPAPAGAAGGEGGPASGQRQRRLSVEAPSWAGAHWHPLAEVVKSGQLANGGTGVFLPPHLRHLQEAVGDRKEELPAGDKGSGEAAPPAGVPQGDKGDGPGSS